MYNEGKRKDKCHLLLNIKSIRIRSQHPWYLVTYANIFVIFPILNVFSFEQLAEKFSLEGNIELQVHKCDITLAK